MPSKTHTMRADSGLTCYLDKGHCKCDLATRILAHAGIDESKMILERVKGNFEFPEEWGPSWHEMNDNEPVTDNEEEESFEIMTPSESASSTHHNKDKNSTDQAEITTKDASSKFFHHEYITDELVADLNFASKTCTNLSRTATSIHNCIEEKLLVLKEHDSTGWFEPSLTPLQELDIANDCRDLFKVLKKHIADAGKNLNHDRFDDGKWANMGAMALKKLLREMDLSSEDVNALEKVQPKPKPMDDWGSAFDTEPVSSWPEMPMEKPELKQGPNWAWGGLDQK